MPDIQQMVETIKREVVYTSHKIGKSALEPEVVEALLEVPRHEFVPDYQKEYSYIDSPLPIGYGQTISQPYMVAIMTDLLRPKPDHVVLEIGSGCGYQSAVLSRLVARVYSIEVIRELSEQTEKRLQRLGYDNVELKCADGYFGWPEHAPYDGIVVTAAATHLPEPLVNQLKSGGRLVIPIGEPGMYQELMLVEKDKNGKTRVENIMGVSFVPLTGAGEYKRSVKNKVNDSKEAY